MTRTFEDHLHLRKAHQYVGILLGQFMLPPGLPKSKFAQCAMRDVQRRTNNEGPFLKEQLRWAIEKVTKGTGINIPKLFTLSCFSFYESLWDGHVGTQQRIQQNQQSSVFSSCSVQFLSFSSLFFLHLNSGLAITFAYVLHPTFCFCFIPNKSVPSMIQSHGSSIPSSPWFFDYF